MIALRNHNRLFGNYRIQVVGKTGWTMAAKKCFVGAATADGREMMVAVLGSSDLWGDLKRLLEFGFGGASHPAPAVPELETAALTTTMRLVTVIARRRSPGRHGRTPSGLRLSGTRVMPRI